MRYLRGGDSRSWFLAGLVDAPLKSLACTSPEHFDEHNELALPVTDTQRAHNNRAAPRGSEHSPPAHARRHEWFTKADTETLGRRGDEPLCEPFTEYVVCVVLAREGAQAAAAAVAAGPKGGAGSRPRWRGTQREVVGSRASRESIGGGSRRRRLEQGRPRPRPTENGRRGLVGEALGDAGPDGVGREGRTRAS